MGNITTCSKCGKEIEYRTKPPKTCEACKKKKQVKKKTKRRYPQKRNTKGELYLFAILDKIIQGHPFINHGYYSNLPSPKGAPMQFDRYYPELKLAFEYDGEGHDKYTKFIHKSYTHFKYIQECDKLKDKLAKEQGITLIRVSYKHKITDDALKIDIKKANLSLYKKLFK